ncbi:MAG: hypothetical protein R3213_06815 [Flavobacteriaceae bacterium]|nr:hypothetical protein [Flavobacteriaceae bacterium]
MLTSCGSVTLKHRMDHRAHFVAGAGIAYMGTDIAISRTPITNRITNKWTAAAFGTTLGCTAGAVKEGIDKVGDPSDFQATCLGALGGALIKLIVIEIFNE